MSQDPSLYAYAVLDAQAAVPPVERTILPGAPLLLVREGAVAVLASPVPREAFTAPADEAETARRALAHHEVTAAAASLGPCLPLSFGAVFSSEAKLSEWLAERAWTLSLALERVAGSAEWTVTLAEDEALHASWLDDHDPALAALAEAIAQAQPGTAYLLARKRERARLASRAERRARLAERIAALLERDARMLERNEDRGALRITALLPQDEAASATGALSALGEELAGSGLALQVSGPWPAYSFARGIDRQGVQHGGAQHG